MKWQKLVLAACMVAVSLAMPFQEAEAKAKKAVPVAAQKTADTITTEINETAEPFPVTEGQFTFQEKLVTRPATDVIVIHHVGVPDGDTSAAAIHRAHLANGWAGIGYHYVIRKDGTIERGRPLDTVGAHASGENEHTVGINVTGNFDKERPTKAQLASLERLLVFLCQTYQIRPSAATIVGHRDVNRTDCPGTHLYPLLSQLREDVKVDLYKESLTHVKLLHVTYPR